MAYGYTPFVCSYTLFIDFLFSIEKKLQLLSESTCKLHATMQASWTFFAFA